MALEKYIFNSRFSFDFLLKTVFIYEMFVVFRNEMKSKNSFLCLKLVKEFVIFKCFISFEVLVKCSALMNALFILAFIM